MKIFHLVKLKGIGGVQSQFEVFFNSLSDSLKKYNFIVNIGSIDPHYSLIKSTYPGYFKKLFIYLLSKNSIVHSYNNLTSKKFLLLYKILKPHYLIFHERGNAWNLPSYCKKVVIDNANLSKKIICNSEASKILLHKKFGVNLDKMLVIYNGVISNRMIRQASEIEKYACNEKYIIGFIGRVDTNKGIQSLIKSMLYLDADIFELHIIGDGDLYEEYKRYVNELNINSVKFFGRVKDAWLKISEFDVMVVPSIREPLGNVVIEAALQKVPIIASEIDGIPEIIKHQYSGILIKPSVDIDRRFISKTVPVPESVVDVQNREIIEPKQLHAKSLSDSVQFLYNNHAVSELYAERLYSDVIKRFHVETYKENLFNLYREVVE